MRWLVSESAYQKQAFGKHKALLHEPAARFVETLGVGIGTAFDSVMPHKGAIYFRSLGR